MLNQKEILSTIAMIDQQHLDIRTITMGISLLSCCDPDAKKACDKIYEKITRYAEKLVKTGEDIQHEFGIPIVNKRISVTPMALVAGASETEDYVPFAMALDRAAKTCGVNFIGGYSALVQKGMTLADEKLIRSIPEALDRTELVCSSINVGSTRAGINMDAVKLMGRIPPPGRQTGTVLAAPSWWCSATPWRTTPSWPAPSTAWARQNGSSTWAFPVRAWCTMPCSP
jgi:uncharacterized protein (UPF0210 family)